jgi:hypothetical protein
VGSTAALAGEGIKGKLESKGIRGKFERQGIEGKFNSTRESGNNSLLYTIIVLTT